uniref:Uncharacterized protein n=1 Tax=Amorphochlora amoebiformis TaxID=1561963 RepID=A0A7S0DP58_9EUKA
MSRSVSQVLIKCIPEEDDDKNASRDVISPPPNSPENNLPPGTCPPSRPKVDKEKGVGAGGRPTYPPPPSEKPKWYNYLLDFVGSWGKDFLSEERARFGVLGFAFGATSAAVLLKLALLILNNDKKKVDVVVIG